MFKSVIEKDRCLLCSVTVFASPRADWGVCALWC